MIDTLCFFPEGCWFIGFLLSLLIQFLLPASRLGKPLLETWQTIIGDKRSVTFHVFLDRSSNLPSDSNGLYCTYLKKIVSHVRARQDLCIVLAKIY